MCNLDKGSLDFSTRLLAVDKKLKLLDKTITKKEYELSELRKTTDYVTDRLRVLNDLRRLNSNILQLLRTVSAKAKESVIFHLEKIVTAALCFIYGGGHEFSIELIERRNRHEVNYYIYDGNIKVQLKKPFVGRGGGKVTLAATALQLAIVEYMEVGGILLLDEITKYADIDAVENVAAFLKDYAKANNRQIVNITHHEAVKEAAGTLINIVKDNKGVANVITEKRSTND